MQAGARNDTVYADGWVDDLDAYLNADSGEGDDNLLGDAGNDLLYGGAGSNQIYGGRASVWRRGLRWARSLPRWRAGVIPVNFVTDLKFLHSSDRNRSLGLMDKRQTLAAARAKSFHAPVVYAGETAFRELFGNHQEGKNHLS